MHENNLDTQADDRELKVQLLRKYSGYLGSLKKEFLKKKKNGKLPKEARQQLLDWWNRHYKWPYPSVTKFYYIHHKSYAYNVCYIDSAHTIQSIITSLVTLYKTCLDQIFFHQYQL